MYELKAGSQLQAGKYTIESVLGQGGFGITYKGTMKSYVSGSLGGMTVDIPVAIKEFFMKDFCVRHPESFHVSVPTVGSKEQADKYRQKFIKEARNISSLSHPNIVKVLDVFEENGTVYYAMQYLEGCSLRELVEQRGAIPEEKVLKYICQIAEALGYMHQEKHLCHLDIKPGNILLDKNDNALLIDFGISKNYDEKGIETSSTPVGLTPGYAPMEQYENSLHEFSPVTDIYSLGATLYYLLVGQTPPQAAIVLEDGIGEQPYNVSTTTWKAISSAMQPLRKNRPQNIKAFLDIINQKKETDFGKTIYNVIESDKTERVVNNNNNTIKEKTEAINKLEDQAFGKRENSTFLFTPKGIMIIPFLLLILAAVLIGVFTKGFNSNSTPTSESLYSEKEAKVEVKQVDINDVIAKAKAEGANWDEAQWKQAFRDVMTAATPLFDWARGVNEKMKELEKNGDDAAKMAEAAKILEEAEAKEKEFEPLTKALDEFDKITKQYPIAKKLSNDKVFQEELKKEFNIPEDF